MMKQIIQNIKDNYKLVILTLITGLMIGWVMTPSGNGETTDAHEGHDHSEEPTVWTCSMHPQIKQDKFGLCPICAMDLIPLSGMDKAEDADPDEITMTESAAKLAEVQTSIVQLGIPEKSIYLQGKIHVDERRIAELTARFGGRIENLYINFTGQQVRKGEKLATIYSPELVSAQQELIETYLVRESNPALYKAARAKLLAWGLTEKQITSIETAGKPSVNFDILSPISGTVMMRHVALGDYVKDGMQLFKVVDLSRVWAMFDAYESDLPWIKTGDKVRFTLQAVPGQSYEANVSYVDPFIDPKTRVAKVRVEVDNYKMKLKPEMFVNAVLESKVASEPVIMIPKTAALWTGKRAVVYTKVENREAPTFLYREITLGAEAGAYYVVEEGLRAGEEIATNGVFKIDAAAQLVGLKSMMNAPSAKNQVETEFAVAGNCDMCKERIEKAASTIYGVASARWSAEKQQIIIKYDPDNATVEAVQKAIAEAGHDTDKYKADDAVYGDLHGCCQYERLDTKIDNAGTTEEADDLQHAMFTVGGNCGMCKERIEEAALTVDGVTSANWNKDTKMIHVNFGGDATEDAIQKAIANAGHDTEKYKADDAVYDDLHGCCQYERLDTKTDNAGTTEEAGDLQHAMFTVGGNCGMCKERIEEAALTIDGVTSANWDKETKMIHVNFGGDATADAIQRAIANVGHDTEKYKADDAVYDDLHGCCQYERL